MPTIPIFKYNLKRKILPGLVTLGCYSENESLTIATPSGKILIYDLNKLANQSDSEENVRALSISQPATSMVSVRFQGCDRDILVVSTKTRVYAYDVERNADVFAREVTDGANVLVHGTLDGRNELIFVGGNCSVQGLDSLGTDAFWIVTGDNVRSVAVADVNEDGENELIVGSDDYDIRVFKKDDLVHEITETQIVTHLHGLGNGLFAYTLANGTVGVYDRLTRLWRVKSKNRATCLLSYDINGDGAMELITGWQGGKVDGRNVKTGEVLFKDNLEQTIAGLCEGDCTNSGNRDLIVITITGEIRCYHPQVPKPMASRAVEKEEEEDVVRELLAMKQALMLELKTFDNNNSKYSEKNENHDGVIPAKTRIQTSLVTSLGNTSEAPHIEVNLSTNNETIIRAVTIFAEGIFKDETHVKHPILNDASSTINVSLYPPRDVSIDIHIKAFVGYHYSKQFHVFELSRQLPRFSMYAPVNKASTDIVSNVVFFVNERIQRVILWINRNFLLSKALDSNTYSELALHFFSLRDGKELIFRMDPAGKITIETDNMMLAGDLIQSLGMYLNVEQLKSVAYYPREEERCVTLLERMKDLETAKSKLNSDLSHKANIVRNLIVRGEDARFLNDLKLMRRFYSQLNQLNDELRNGYEIRVTNYNDIVKTVKDLNGIVQKASRLRFGKCTTDPMSLAKMAISTGNSGALIKVIRTGEM